MEQSFDEIKNSLPEIEKNIENLKETLLANLVMAGEIPAPTFEEEERIEFLMNRFKESEITQNSIDEMGNGIGIMEGTEDDGNILVVAHADTVFDANVDHTIQIQPQQAFGPGVADNSLGMAVLCSIPTILDELDITLNHNLILMGATRSLGRGNLEGLQFFLSNFEEPIKAGLGIEGVELGRLSHTSIGMKRGEITCEVPEEYDWSRFGDASAILTLNEVINKINEIKLPQRPRTSIIMGSLHSGTSFTTAIKGTLQFEIRSKSSDLVQEIHQRLQEIISEVSAHSGDYLNLEILAQREPGGLGFSNPYVRCTQEIMNQLNIEPRPGPSTSELSAFIDADIPAITLGITHGDNVRDLNESIEIAPMYKGITQVIGTLLALDRGYCE